MCSNAVFSLFLFRSKIRTRDLIMPLEQLEQRSLDVLSGLSTWLSTMWATSLLVPAAGMSYSHCCVHLLLNLLLLQNVYPVVSQLWQLNFMMINITCKPEVLLEAYQVHRVMLQDARCHTQTSISNNHKPIMQSAWKQDNTRVSIVHRSIQGLKQQYQSSIIVIQVCKGQGDELSASTRISTGEANTRHTSILALGGMTLLADGGTIMDQHGTLHLKPQAWDGNSSSADKCEFSSCRNDANTLFWISPLLLRGSRHSSSQCNMMYWI